MGRGFENNVFIRISSVIEDHHNAGGDVHRVCKLLQEHDVIPIS